MQSTVSLYVKYHKGNTVLDDLALGKQHVPDFPDRRVSPIYRR